VSKPFDADHPEQVAYDQTCSMWLTEGTIVERLRIRNGRPDGFGLGLLCDEAAKEIERLRGQVAEWERLRDPANLHINLLRGIPCKLDRAAYLHLAGDEPPNAAHQPEP
jgi:hypothetical protein